MVKNLSNSFKLQTPNLDLNRIKSDMRAISDEFSHLKIKEGSQNESDKGFIELLERGLNEVNQNIQTSEKLSMDLASGKETNIHETMLAATKAELSFSMLVQVRNKVIEAYQEVMRMQV